MELKETTAVDLLASPEVLALLEQVRQSAPALTHALQRVERLTATGALDTMLDLAEVVHAARSSMSDGMIARMGTLVRVLGETADTLVTSGLPEKLPAMLQAAGEAREEAEADQSTLGVFAAMKALKQPEIQFSLKFMLALARRMPQAVKE